MIGIRTGRLATITFGWIALAIPPACGGGFEEDRIKRLVQQLGASTFQGREAAGLELVAIGEPALPEVKSAARQSEDAEIRQRARYLIRRIIWGARFSRSIRLELALVDSGEFPMGSATSEVSRRADETLHCVRITEPFLMGAYEVTQDEYRRIMGLNPSWFSPEGGGKDKVAGMETRRFPVDSVSWFDAIEFCNRLSAADELPPYYLVSQVIYEQHSIKSAQVEIAGGPGYRLPTEAEWEYACRAGTTGRFHYGTSSTGAESNIKSGTAIGYGGPSVWQALGRTTRVGSYKPNAWGLFDMHGNAAEWCWDWYGEFYYDTLPQDGSPAVRNPHGPASGRHRVQRGGSWLVNDGLSRSASRFWHTPDERKDYTGFRVARSP